MFVITETVGVIKHDRLGGVLASHRDIWDYRFPLTMEVSCHCVPQMSKYLRGNVQTEGKYSKLIYFVFEGTSCWLDVLVHESKHPASLF